MIATIALFASLVHFDGGSTADLASQVGKSTGRNVFIAQAFEQSIKAFDYDTKGYEDLAFDIRMHAKVKVVVDKDLVFSDDLLLPDRLGAGEIGKNAKLPTWKTLQPADLSDGKITFHTIGNERLDPAKLADFAFTHPVKVHWLLGGYGVAISADKMDEKDFLSCIAKSVGGKLSMDASGYLLDLDPDPFRTRASKLIDLRKETDIASPDKAQIPLALTTLNAVLGEISKADLIKAFQTEHSKAQFQVDTSSAIATTFSSAFMRTAAMQQDSRNRYAFKTPRGFAYLDPSAGFSVVLGADFTTTIGFTTRLPQDKNPTPMTVQLSPRG